MTANPEGRRRYEGIFRAIRRRSQMGLLLCLVATALLAGIWLFWIAPIVVEIMLDAGLPGWLIAALPTAAFLTFVLTIPNLAQLIVIRGDTAAAIEAVNALALSEGDRLKREVGKVPRLRNASQAMAWLAAHPDASARFQARLLAWAGESERARAEVAGMSAGTATEAFDVALLRGMVEFIATGKGDLQPARAELKRVPDADQDWARLALAFEEARLEVAAGREWAIPLAAARRSVAVPRAATLIGRFLSAWRLYLAVVIGGTLLSVIAALQY